MEGLIPFLVHAMKKQRPHNSYRSVSVGSSRSYHVLVGGDANSSTVEGSSHRRTKSEFKAPTTDFLEQRSGFGCMPQTKSYKRSSTNSTPNSFQVSKSKYWLLPHARGLELKPRREGFPSGAKKEWGLSPKAKVRVLHTAQLNVTWSTRDESSAENSGRAPPINSSKISKRLMVISIYGRVDIFDMVDIDLFIVVALNMMVLKLGYTCKSEPMFYNYLRPLTSLDEGLYALACKEDVRCQVTLVRSFKLIDVYIEHGVITLDSYLWAPRFRATLEEINDLLVALQQTELKKSETQSELLVSEEPDVGRTQEPILEEVSIQEPIMAEVSTQEPIMREDFSVEDVVIEDYVSSREDAAQYNGEFNESARNEENEIVEPDIDVHLFGISMDLPFDNISVTNLVPDNVLETEDVDASIRMVSTVTMKFLTLKEAKDRVYLPFIESKRNLMLCKNDGVRIRARCDGKVHVFTMSHGDVPTGPKRRMEPGPNESSGPTTMSKKRKNTSISADSQESTSGLDAHDKGDLCPWVFWVLEHAEEICCLDGAFMKRPFLGQVLVAVGLDSNNGIYPLAYALVEAESKSSWCQFLQCLGDEIDMVSFHPLKLCTQVQNTDIACDTYMKTRSRDGVNKHTRICCGELHLLQREKYDLLLNNICQVFNGKIVRGRDKLVIILLEYIKEYCMKRIMNVQGVIDKCTGPLTSIATRIIKSIKKEAHLMKVQWNKANKYQVSGGTTPRNISKSLLLVEYMEGNIFSQDTTNLGRPRKKRKRSKHKDEPFVKDGGNNAEASGSASRQAQQTKPAAGQGGSCRSGVGGVIGLSTAAGEGGQCDVGVSSQGSSHSRWNKSKVQTKRMSPQKRTHTQPVSQPSISSQVPVSEIRNADEREMGDGVLT
nr:hypothetical protein [Tanacetum cinerariifolium]